MICKKCRKKMTPGIALQQTYTGTPDFPGGEVVTMSPGGPGRLINCLKCPGCGYSRTMTAGERAQEELEIACARYEYVMNLTPSEFKELWENNSRSGTPFNELIDRAIEGET